eukprot:ANDGO_00066.mRNA.1 DNA polymerase epsilon subunit B
MSGIPETLLKKEFIRQAQIKGFSVRPEALTFVLSHMTDRDRASINSARSVFLSLLDFYAQRSRANAVELSELERIFADTLNTDGRGTAPIQVVSAFQVPKLVYNPGRSLFFPVATDVSKPRIFASAESKVALWKDRYNMIRQRVLRSVSFVKDSFQKAARELTPIQALLGDLDRARSKVVLGMLVHLEGGPSEWYLEDAGSHVPLDLTRANMQISRGFFTESSFVLCEGKYDEGIFRVESMLQPPAEDRETSLRWISGDHLGLSLDNSLSDLEDPRMIIMSDVHLDDPRVVELLDSMLSKLEDSGPPTVIVLMGDFLSHAYGSRPSDHEELTQCLDSFGSMILKYKSIAKETSFVFVPGPGDPSLGGSALPRPQFPASISRLFKERIANSYFSSNPCRIRISGKEVFICRENILSKMRRHCVVQPDLSEASDLSEHLVSTILSQGHFSPVSLTSQPVYWELDHALHLFPLPDVLVLGDTCSAFLWQHYGCHCIHPGVFSIEHKFGIYSPSDGSIDLYQAHS